MRHSLWLNILAKGDRLFINNIIGSAYPSGAPAISPIFLWRSCCLVFSFLCCFVCTTVCLLVLFFFGRGVVSLLSSYEIESSIGLFRCLFTNVYSKWVSSLLSQLGSYCMSITSAIRPQFLMCFFVEFI